MITRLPDLPAFSAEAYDLQRIYAAHLLLLRGFVPGVATPVPTEDWFDISDNVVMVGQVTTVTLDFASPPLLAYVDEVPVTLQAVYNPITFKTTVGLIAPEGTRGGPVQLIWPSKTLLSRRPLWIAGRVLDMRQSEAPVGGDLVVGLFHERPLEVHIGTKELPSDAIVWENRLLQVRVPPDVPPGLVLVVTEGQVYRSLKPFTPGTRKKPA